MHLMLSCLIPASETKLLATADCHGSPIAPSWGPQRGCSTVGPLNDKGVHQAPKRERATLR